MQTQAVFNETDIEAAACKRDQHKSGTWFPQCCGLKNRKLPNLAWMGKPELVPLWHTSLGTPTS